MISIPLQVYHFCTQIIMYARFRQTASYDPSNLCCMAVILIFYHFFNFFAPIRPSGAYHFVLLRAIMEFTKIFTVRDL